MERKGPQAVLAGHQGAVYDAVWHAQSGRWVTAGGDGVVAAWDPASPEPAGEAWLHHSQPFFSLGTDGDWMHAGTDQGEWWSWRPGEQAGPRRLLAHARGLFVLTPIPPGVLYTGGGDGRFARWEWDGAQWQAAGAWSIPTDSAPTPTAAPPKIRCLAPGPGTLLVGTAQHGWGIWDVARSHWHHWQADGGAYCALWLAQKSAWLLGGRDGHLRVQHGPAGSVREVVAFPAHQGTVYRLVATDRALWTASRDRTLKAWHPTTLAPLTRLERVATGHTRSVNALAARPLPYLAESPSDATTPSHVTPVDWQLLSGGDDRRAHLHLESGLF